MAICDKSCVRRDRPCCRRSATWICTCGHTINIVIYSRFHRNPFRGFGATTGGVEIWPFPSLWLFAFIYSSLCYGTNRDSELFVESRKYFVPHVYLAAPLEVTPLEFPPKIFENYNSWTIVVVIYMMTSLAVLIEHRLVKNRRTQGYNINRASIASRSKKQGHSTD